MSKRTFRLFCSKHLRFLCTEGCSCRRPLPSHRLISGGPCFAQDRDVHAYGNISCCLNSPLVPQPALAAVTGVLAHTGWLMNTGPSSLSSGDRRLRSGRQLGRRGPFGAADVLLWSWQKGQAASFLRTLVPLSATPLQPCHLPEGPPPNPVTGGAGLQHADRSCALPSFVSVSPPGFCSHVPGTWLQVRVPGRRLREKS